MVDEDEVDDKSDKEGGSKELGASKIIGFSKDGQSNHGDRDSDTNGDGILFDIGGEAIFNTFSVVFESENDAGETDAGKIKERHFNGGVGIF